MTEPTPGPDPAAFWRNDARPAGRHAASDPLDPPPSRTPWLALTITGIGGAALGAIATATWWLW